jgi:hypothetical protein
VKASQAFTCEAPPLAVILISRRLTQPP